MMEIWQDKFPKSGWATFLAQKGNPLQLESIESTRLLKELLRECSDLLHSGQIGRGLDRLSLGCVIDKDYFLTRLKRDGLLRHSAYLNQRNPVAGIAQHFLIYHALFLLSDNEILYFKSLQYLEKFSLEMKDAYNFITRTILRYKIRKSVKYDNLVAKTSIVKSLLAMNDYIFLNRTGDDTSLQPNFDQIDYTIEEMSDAVSFLISRADELIQIDAGDLLLIDEDFVKSNVAQELIVQACRFKAFKEIEISIESLGYICKKDGSIIRILYKDDRTFRSMELSNIISHRQKDTAHFYLQQQLKDFPGLKELAAFIHESFPNLVILKETPYKRYTLNLPMPLIEAIGKEKVGAFREEHSALSYIQDELSLPISEIKQYELTKGLSLHDFMSISRVFTILQIIYSEKLREFSTKENYLIVLNSILTTFGEEQLLDLLTTVLPKEKVLSYLRILSWEAGKNQYLDLQYTPIVQKDKHYLICLSVMTHSIMVRNIFSSLAKRGINPKAQQVRLLQLIPKQLKESFSKKGFTCFTDLKINFKGPAQVEGDIDFFAYKDGHLFIGECKDVIDSIDSFEYRRINDYLNKAASQLNYIKSALDNPQYLTSVSERVGIDLSTIAGIHFLIIPSARKMYGHNVGDYPVRNVHELIGFVNHGTVQYRLPGENLFSFKIWQTDEFEVKDLITFCSAESFHEEFFKSLEMHAYTLGKNIELMAYGLNALTVLKNLKNKYRYEEIPFDDIF